MRNITMPIIFHKRRFKYAYPNALWQCRVGATVSYNLAKTGSVMLTIFDTYAGVIKAYNTGMQRAGIHSYKLNHIDNRPGNYFIKVEQESNVGETRIIVSH